MSRTGLRNRFDGKTIHLGAGRIARDAGGTDVDDVPDAGHGQRGFGDVGGQHDPPAVGGGEHLLLVGYRQAREQRHDLGPAGSPPFECLCGVADVAFGGQENEDVAALVGPQFGDRGVDALDLVEVGVIVFGVGCITRSEWPIPDLDRVRASGYFDDGYVGIAGNREMLCEPAGFDGRRGDDHLQIPAARQQLLEIAEDEVDIEAALVRLVDDEGVVGTQHRVGGDLAQQDAVGHHLDQGVCARTVGEAHRIADGVADLGTGLVGDTFGHGTGGDAPGLGVPDGAANPAAGLQTDLGQLCGLARTCFACHHNHLVCLEGGGDLLTCRADR